MEMERGEKKINAILKQGVDTMARKKKKKTIHRRSVPLSLSLSLSLTLSHGCKRSRKTPLQQALNKQNRMTKRKQ